MSSPVELLLELVRGEEAEAPFHFRPVPREYLLRRGQGSHASAALAWEPELLADLAELERPVHLTFRFAAAELYALPWELLTLGSSGRPLAELPGVLIRYEWPSADAAPPTGTSRAGRILYAGSSAGGQVPHQAHLSARSRACEQGAHPFIPGRDVLPDFSLGTLAEALARPGEPAAILHLLCHGGRRGQPYGLLWDASWSGGEPELVDGAALRQRLVPHAGTLRLVVLAACQSGAGLAGNHLGSVAQALHRAGIQAVVASRLPLSSQGSAVFSPLEDEVRLLTGSADGTARSWRPREPLPNDALLERLRTASSACLTAWERQLHLDDLPAHAREASDACEREQGRTPN